jgi:hypothetical protein
MKEQTSIDKIFKEARTRAIENAYIPKSIRDEYSVTKDLKTGKIVFGKKTGKK